MSTNFENLWMPFSANRDFKSAPRLMNEANGIGRVRCNSREFIITRSRLKALLKPERWSC